MAGIVEHYHKSTGHTPILGMWRQSLNQDLLWMRINLLPETAPCWPNIPSWSWLSCPVGINFDCWAPRGDEDEGLVDVHDHATILDVDVTWTSNSLTSDVKDSRLMIEGPAKEIVLSIAPLGGSFNPPYLDVEDEELDFETHPIPWRCAGQFDRSLGTSRSPYLCLLLRSRTYLKTTWVKETFLILEPSSEGLGRSSEYRRVGLANFRGESRTFDWTARRTVSLI